MDQIHTNSMVVVIRITPARGGVESGTVEVSDSAYRGITPVRGFESYQFVV